jgi:predicted nuclease of predicted toxin-antitoxin system
MDENIEIAVSLQLNAFGIDAISVQSTGSMGKSDFSHLSRAQELGRVLCSYDSDFVMLAVEGIEHAGIIKGTRSKMTIGQWVRDIRIIHARYEAEMLANRVIYLPLK